MRIRRVTFEIQRFELKRDRCYLVQDGALLASGVGQDDPKIDSDVRILRIKYVNIAALVLLVVYICRLGVKSSAVVERY